MNLEQLRKQAKELARAARSGDEEGLARIRRHAPERARVLLADAQLALARERGYRGWPALVAAAEASTGAFVLAATSGRRERAARMLAARPELERDRWAALVLGRGWDGDASEVGGPREWAPLHYVCHSCFANVELARELLRRGADPNAYFANEYGPMSTLYGAAGVIHDPELTRVLLETGADPNAEPQFGDALYHSVEAEATDCLRLLLEHGARVRGTNALAHALDYPRFEHVRLLLEADGDANEGALLVHAVRRGRGPECIRLLVEHGAELDRRGGEGSTPPERYKTAYQNAMVRGRADLAGVLAELGASTDLEPEELAVGAVVRGERPSMPLPAELGPDAQEALVLAALDGRLDAVVDLVGPNFFGHAGGGPPGTLLHHAAWAGNADVVGALIALGGDPVARSGAHFDTPLAWAFLGSSAWKEEGRDYVGVAEQLVAAGADLEPRFVEVAEGPLAAWLEAHD
ncbi:MAG: ankyrin repeat domain-containing protein [Actinobacteria bacterium]|nr:ankyrin repeat domain-containing protein [Actinomycetota bacterium]